MTTSMSNYQQPRQAPDSEIYLSPTMRQKGIAIPENQSPLLLDRQMNNEFNIVPQRVEKVTVVETNYAQNNMAPVQMMQPVMQPVVLAPVMNNTGYHPQPLMSQGALGSVGVLPSNQNLMGNNGPHPGYAADGSLQKQQKGALGFLPTYVTSVFNKFIKLITMTSLFVILLESVLSLALLATFYSRLQNKEGDRRTWDHLFRDIFALMAADAYLILVCLYGFSTLGRIFNKPSVIRSLIILLTIGLIWRLVCSLIFFSPPNGENNYNEIQMDNYDRLNRERSGNTLRDAINWRQAWFHEIAALVLITFFGTVLVLTLLTKLVELFMARNQAEIAANAQNQPRAGTRTKGYTPAALAIFTTLVMSVISLALIADLFRKVGYKNRERQYGHLYRALAAQIACDAFAILVSLIALAMLKKILNSDRSISLIRTFRYLFIAILVWNIINRVIILSPPGGNNVYNEIQDDRFNALFGNRRASFADEAIAWRQVYRMMIASVVIIPLAIFLLLSTLNARRHALMNYEKPRDKSVKSTAPLMVAILVESIISLALLAHYYRQVDNINGRRGTYPHFFRNLAALIAADAFFALVMIYGLAMLKKMNHEYKAIRTFLMLLALATVFRLVTALIYFSPPNGEDRLKDDELATDIRLNGRNDEASIFRVAYHHEIAAIIIINICAFLIFNALLAKHRKLENEHYNRNAHKVRPIGYTPSLLGLSAILVESIISLVFLAIFLERTNKRANHGTYPNLFRDIPALMAADAFLILVSLLAMALIRKILNPIRPDRADGVAENRSDKLLKIFKYLLLAGLIFRIITAVIFFSPPNGENNFNEEERNRYDVNPRDREASHWNRTYWHELAAIIIINIAGALVYMTWAARQRVLKGHNMKNQYGQANMAQNPEHGIQMRNNNI